MLTKEQLLDLGFEDLEGYFEKEISERKIWIYFQHAEDEYDKDSFTIVSDDDEQFLLFEDFDEFLEFLSFCQITHSKDGELLNKFIEHKEKENEV